MHDMELPPILVEHQEELLRGLALGAEASVLDWVTDFVAKVLGVTYCFVGELTGDDWHRVRTVSMHERGGRGEQMSYDLDRTPCVEVLTCDAIVCPRDVALIYPHDDLAVQMNLSGYCGAQLTAKGHVIGILVACCPNELSDPESCKAVMNWLAPRTGRALQRLQHDQRMSAVLSVVQMSSGQDDQYWARRAADLLGLRVAITLVIRDGRRRLAGVLVDGTAGSAPVDTDALLSGITGASPVFTADDLDIRISGVNLCAGITVPFTDASGEICGWLCLLHDFPLRPNPLSLELAVFIADRLGATRALQQQARAELEERRRQAEGQRMEALGLMAGSIAHDVNNLLVAILGNASLAREVISEVSPAYDYLDDIELAAQRSADLAKQLLAYSGKGRFVVQPVNASHVVRSMTDLLRVALPKNVSLRLRLDNGVPAVDADITQLRQVVMNLVVNGAEAIGPNDGEVSVFSGVMRVDAEYLAAIDAAELSPGQFVFIEVSDTGCGMSNEVCERIFEPFFTTKPSGRGLGLAAVTGIVRGHGGALRVYSEVGKGTTFKLLLPVSDQTVVEEKSRRAPKQAPKGKGLILVVDDEPSVRKMACRALEFFGFETLQAESGEAAFVLFQETSTPIRLVLLDMTMPGMNGEELFRKLRVLDSNVIVVLMSGYNEQEATSRFVGKGLAGFMQKPFGVGDLREKIFGALGETLPS